MPLWNILTNAVLKMLQANVWYIVCVNVYKKYNCTRMYVCEHVHLIAEKLPHLRWSVHEM